MPVLQKIRLGDLLVEQGLLTQEQLQFALQEQKRTGRKLGRVFVESGFVTEEGISKALARQLRVPFIDLKGFSPQPEFIKLLPEAPARRFRALILAQQEDGRLQVGLSDPTDLQSYDEISRLLHREIELAVVTESQLLATIDRVYHQGEQIIGLARELTAELGDVPIEFGDLLGSATGTEDAPVVKLLQTVFEEATRLRASDIHFEPQQETLRIRFRIDGVLHVQTQADAKVSSAVALRLKLISGLDISEKRLPQDGRFNIKVRGSPVDVRISTLPTQFGESVVMRLLNQNTGLLELDKIGMPPRVLERFRHALKRPSGMVLVTGPTGSGKTTTLYAALNELNSPEKKLITVEDPVEYRLSGVVLVKAMPGELRSVDEYLKATQLVVERQVMLEAKILEVVLSDSYQTGINWSQFGGLTNKFALGIAAPGATLSGSGTISGSATGISAGTAVSARPGRDGSLATSGDGRGFFGLTFQSKDFAALLSFLEGQGDVQVLSSPRIATTNNQKAVLKVGSDDYFVTSVSTNTTTSASGNVVTPNISLQPFFSGISLDVTPQIDDEGNIILHVHPSVSVVEEKTKSLDLGSMGTFTLPLASSTINETDSIVRVQDGSIVAIGGLMSQEQNNSRYGLPTVSGVPVLGNLFGQKIGASRKRELVILMRSTVIKGENSWRDIVAETQERLQNFDPRQPRQLEWRR